MLFKIQTKEAGYKYDPLMLSTKPGKAMVLEIKEAIILWGIKEAQEGLFCFSVQVRVTWVCSLCGKASTYAFYWWIFYASVIFPHKDLTKSCIKGSQTQDKFLPGNKGKGGWGWGADYDFELECTQILRYIHKKELLKNKDNRHSGKDKVEEIYQEGHKIKKGK